MEQRILISGASIAGLALAHWLARYGLRPTVIERADAPRAGGQGVDVRGQAVEVVERMGLAEQIRARAADVQGMKFVDAADRTIARVDIDDPGGIEVMRGDLLTLLHRAVGDGTELVFGDSITAIDQDGRGATVAFARRPRERFDLVIGADGVHSNVRGLAFGPEDRFLRHKGHYFAFADADSALGEDRWMTIHNHPGRLSGVYRSGNHAQAKAYFMFRSAPLAHDDRDPRRLLRDAVANDTSWHTRALLEGALDDPECYVDSLGQVHLDSWSRGRVALVGDAAWCASPAAGAGAELALVGAYLLAGAIASSSGDHRAAFTRYERAHRPLVRERQRIGPNLRLMIPGTAAGMRLRDAALRLPLIRALGALESRFRRPAAPLPAFAA